MSDAVEQGKAYVEKMRAAGKSDADIMAALLAAGWAEANVTQVLGPPPEEDPRDLFTAASEGAAGRVRYLLMKGQDANSRGPLGPVLVYAVRHKRAPVVEVLLQWNVNVHAAASDGQTALHLAAMNNDTLIVGKLLSTGVDPDTRNMGRATALHLAAMENLPDMAKFLVDSRAEVNADDDSGRTPLHRAAERGFLTVMDVLLGAGAEVDNVDAMGRTPLHLAAKAGQAEACRRLLSAGAQINCQDNSSKTPLGVATGEAATLIKGLGGK